MFKEKVQVKLESDEIVQERASENVGNVFVWTSGAEVGRELKLLNGRPVTNCRMCGTRIVLDVPWSIDEVGNVVIVRKYAEVTRDGKSIRLEVEPFLCPADFEKQAAEIVTPKPIPPAPEKIPQYHADTSRGRVHGIGRDAAEAWDSLTRDWKQLIGKDQFVANATICEGI